VAASATICDFIRSFASGFIFTTSLPPMVAAGALTSIRHLRTSAVERERHQDRVARLRLRLDEAGLPHLRNPSHIVPVMVGDPVLCKQISDILIDRHGIYVQPINYPTVPRGTERLRITPAPYHSDADIEHLVQALAEVWTEVGLTISSELLRPRMRSASLRRSLRGPGSRLSVRSFANAAGGPP
jgi:5-aminolevulinate synthase